MRVTVATDVSGEIPLQEFLTGLEKHCGQVVSYVASGPGGGNPEVTLSFPDEDMAKAYLMEFDYDVEAHAVEAVPA